MNANRTQHPESVPTPASGRHADRAASTVRDTLWASLITAVASAAAAVLVSGCGGGGDGSGGPGAAAGDGGGPQSAAAAQSLQLSLSALPLDTLAADEAAGLLLMREEEKMARDVYAVLYTAWGSRVFDNIGVAEQTHMDSVKLLLDRYALADPAAATAAGQFGNAALQGLYDALVMAGRSSVTEALKVGAEIEDVDIRDLRVLKAATDNADLLLVYDNLERGSRNHLRAFHNNLQRLAVTYTPKYLTQAEYDAIVGTPQERGTP